jgi:hypothetical protein
VNPVAKTVPDELLKAVPSGCKARARTSCLSGGTSNYLAPYILSGLKAQQGVLQGSRLVQYQRPLAPSIPPPFRYCTLLKCSGQNPRQYNHQLIVGALYDDYDQ